MILVNLHRVKLLCCMLGISPLRPAVAALNWTSSAGLRVAVQTILKWCINFFPDSPTRSSTGYASTLGETSHQYPSPPLTGPILRTVPCG